MSPRFAIEQARSDLAQAARGLLRRPGFAPGDVLALAGAVGASTAVFNVVDGHSPGASR
jgi:hypothetical protein